MEQEERQLARLKKQLAGKTPTSQADRCEHAAMCEQTAKLLYSLGEHEEALQYWDKYSQFWTDRAEAAEFMYQQRLLTQQLASGNVLEEARTDNKLGALFSRMGTYEKAAEYHSMAVGLSRMEGDLRAEAEANSLLGVALGLMGRLDEAVQCFEVELAFATRACEPVRQAQALANLSAVYKKMGDTERSQSHLERSQRLFKLRDGEEGFVQFDPAFETHRY
eukprot:TRINITY_DN2099_c0_g1_i1.p1 TRINITY_DN2099_c0_g1~~TRINITY_DN2099_c0_g1_i1.p1  ORF type:complete len:221 (+),score=76.72 TRINITY_DN2099_c0_g1_i1:220-882(+)